MQWKVVMMILWYLEGTMYCSCCYQDKELNLIDYPDANLVCDVTPRPDEGHSICNCSGTYVHQVSL